MNADLALFLNTILVVIYFDNWWKAMHWWFLRRDLRSLRAFVIAIQLLALVLSSYAYIALTFMLGNRTAGAIIVSVLWGVALTGGIVTFTTNARQRPTRDKP